MGPGTTCWPGGVLKCSPGVGGSKMASRGVELLLTPPPRPPMLESYGKEEKSPRLDKQTGENGRN